ncbi:hypothetical protein [Lysobacter capsici]|uniref:hypothetical protein n=1 Tax=Lysobacter capsici TaxID=435897 RepID=UPI00287B6A08|nr:hypothetical protein [Lysobacter capsici]WND79425.1 hypothetical protein RJ610_19290 [Lysobacter capsici]WND84621.1 hypothetical protein RJ609_19305 [Lysobacter capsici]
MNTERLIKLAEWLEAGAKHERITFDMSKGIELRIPQEFEPSQATSCNSSCCLAGATIQFFGDVRELADISFDPWRSLDAGMQARELNWWNIADQAEMLLDLSRTQASYLFKPWNYHIFADLPRERNSNLNKSEAFNDPAWAARTIRHLIATGEANWEATRQTLDAQP